jgi:AraC-like DNA-binding protein
MSLGDESIKVIYIRCHFDEGSLFTRHKMSLGDESIKVIYIRCHFDEGSLFTRPCCLQRMAHEHGISTWWFL